MKVVFFSPRLYILFTGTYIDKKCPFTGTVSVRGRILAGTCHSAKMNRTIIVRRNYLHWVKKYQRQGLALFLFSTLVLVLLPFLLVPLNKMPPT
jgi:succinate dehydrogenase/fumarate reductase cytochrome b subunit